MKKLIAILLVLCVCVLFASCGNKNADSSDTSSTQTESITINPTVDNTGVVSNYDPNNTESHVITEEGKPFERTTNQRLDVADFVNAGGAVLYAVQNKMLGRTVNVSDLNETALCTSVQMALAMDINQEEITVEQFDKVLFDNFGIKQGGKTYSVTNICTFDGKYYHIKQYPFVAAYGTSFNECQLLGNGFVKYFGEFSYSAAGTLENEEYYTLTCLIKHTSESEKGMNLVSFEVTKADKSIYEE